MKVSVLLNAPTLYRDHHHALPTSAVCTAERVAAKRRDGKGLKRRPRSERNGSVTNADLMDNLLACTTNDPFDLDPPACQGVQQEPQLHPEGDGGEPAEVSHLEEAAV